MVDDPRLLPGEVLPGDHPVWYRMAEAAAAVNMIPRVLRKAIHAGSLRAYTPGGAHPVRLGKSGGYLIARRDLQAWYFGDTRKGQFTPPGGFDPLDPFDEQEAPDDAAPTHP